MIGTEAIRLKRRIYQRKYISERPWIKTHSEIIQRCQNKNCISYKRYGAIGIKCRITPQELKQLWLRDCAVDMKRPSIDRIDSSKDYVFDNCRYIELSENSGKDLRVPVIHIGKNGKKTSYKSTMDASIGVFGVYKSRIHGCIKRGVLFFGERFVFDTRSDK